MEVIHINQVLSEIRASTADTSPFMLRVVKSTGRDRGAIRTYGACLKGTPQREESKTRKASKSGKQGGFQYRFHDVIPIIDLEAGGKFRTLPISHIIGYKHFKVTH